MLPAVALALIAILAVIAIAYPLLREPVRGDRVDELAPDVRARLGLREQRDAALEAIRDLELDRRCGKITDQDFAPLVARERRRAADAIAALAPLDVDAPSAEATPVDDPVDAEAPAQ